MPLLLVLLGVAGVIPFDDAALTLPRALGREGEGVARVSVAMLPEGGWVTWTLSMREGCGCSPLSPDGGDTPDTPDPDPPTPDTEGSTLVPLLLLGRSENDGTVNKFRYIFVYSIFREGGGGINGVVREW